MTAHSRPIGCATAALVLSLHGFALHALPAGPGQIVPPTRRSGAITGTVIAGLTGHPVGGAVVTLGDRASNGQALAQQVATPTGRFAFLNLTPDAAYLLTATKPGYLDGAYGQPEPLGPSVTLPLSDGQWISDVRVVLTPPGSISGSVLDERGEPVVGAYVRVLPQVLVAGHPQWVAGAVARTDDRGAYRLGGLGPGKYEVQVPSVGATMPVSATVTPATATAGNSRADLDRPAQERKAPQLVVDLGNGQQAVVGQYAVPPPAMPDGRPGVYPAIFYPDTADPAEASPIELGPGEARGGVIFQLHPVPIARLSGRVQGPPEMVGNLVLRLVPVGLEGLGLGSEAATTITAADGGFAFLGVPAGTYEIEARHSVLQLTATADHASPTWLPSPIPFPISTAASYTLHAAPPGVGLQWISDGNNSSYWGQLRVTVAGQNVDDVAVALQRPLRMTGRMLWAAGSTPGAGSPGLTLEPADGRGTMAQSDLLPPGLAAGHDPSEFTIEGIMAGSSLLRVRGATVLSIIWNGEDYTDRPFDSLGGRDFTDVLVTLTRQSSSLTGLVREGAAPISTGAAILVFPVDRELWSNYGFTPTRLKSAMTTPDGRYEVDGLPVGDYYVLAVEASEGNGWLDPTYLERHAAQASRVRIDRPGASVSVPLSLVK